VVVELDLVSFQTEAREWLRGLAKPREGGDGDEDLRWGAVTTASPCSTT
jgi:hypothetical protein